MDDSWNQNARAKKIFWKGGAKAQNHLNWGAQRQKPSLSTWQIPSFWPFAEG